MSTKKLNMSQAEKIVKRIEKKLAEPKNSSSMNTCKTNSSKKGRSEPKCKCKKKVGILNVCFGRDCSCFHCFENAEYKYKRPTEPKCEEHIYFVGNGSQCPKCGRFSKVEPLQSREWKTWQEKLWREKWFKKLSITTQAHIEIYITELLSTQQQEWKEGLRKKLKISKGARDETIWRSEVLAILK